MYPPVQVHPPAVVPRQVLVTMCHRNPCLMGRQPAGSQDRKQPGQRSVLAPRVPARGHATSGRMIPMLEAPPLPSLLYIYVCGLWQGEGKAFGRTQGNMRYCSESAAVQQNNHEL